MDPIEQLLEERLKNKKKKSHVRGKLVRWDRVALIVLVCALLFRIFFGISVVRGSSMYPYLKDGDVVLYLRHPHRLQTDDIILIRSDAREPYIKRIAAVPGETVDITTDGQILVDGTRVDDAYSFGSTWPREIALPAVLSRNEFFVLGDNRVSALDSRSFGTVTEKEICGRVILKFGL